MSSNEKIEAFLHRNVPEENSGVVTEPEIVDVGHETSSLVSGSEFNASPSDLYSEVLRHNRNALPETRNLFQTSNSGRNADYYMNGCARTTPILNQRFGINFTRRYTMPHGAPYPLRPSPDSQSYRNVFQNSPSAQARQSTSYLDMPVAQNVVYPLNQKQEYKQQQHSSFQTSHSFQTLGAQTQDIQGSASEDGTTSVHSSQKNATIPILESTFDSHSPIIWREVHHRREESISTQRAAKSIELAEFQKAFCNDTPVREVLASGWFKKHVSGVMETSDTSTSRKSKSVQDIVKQPIKDCKKADDEQTISQNVNANRTTIAGESFEQILQQMRKGHSYKPPAIRSRSLLSSTNRIPTKTLADELAEKPVCSPDNVFNKSVNDIKRAAERAEKVVNCVNPNVYPKEQFPKEIVEHAQQMQVQAQQVVQKRKGMNTSCLEDPRYFSQIKPQRKTIKLDGFLDNYKSNMQQVEYANQFSREIKSDSPNILRKSKHSNAFNLLKSDNIASELNQNQLVIPDGLNPPSTSFNEILDAAHTNQYNEETKTPQKRQRKQLFVPDGCSFTQASNSPGFDKAEENVIDTVLKTTVPKTPINEKPSSQTIDEKKEDVFLTPKKIRGRPRKTPKDEASSTTFKSQKELANISNPRKRFSNMHTENIDKEEKMARFQTSSSQAISSVEKNSTEKSKEKNPTKSMKKNTQKSLRRDQKVFQMQDDDDQQQGQLSLTHSLQFLQSLATTDPHTLLFGGSNARTLIDIDSNNFIAHSNLHSGNQTNSNSSYVLEEKEDSIPPPTATAVAKSGQPLILNFHNFPKLIETPIWTDDSGALVPLSMYRKDMKKEREPLHCFLREQEDETKVQRCGTSQLTCYSNKDDISNTLHDTLIDKCLIKQHCWKPADNAVRRGMKKLNRGVLSKSQTKASFQTVHNTCGKLSNSKKRSDSNWTRFLAIKQAKLQRINLKKYKYVLFQKDTSTDAHVKKSMCRKFNEYWDKLVTTCCLVEFDQTSTYVRARIDNTSSHFDINWSSRDCKNRWFHWQQSIIRDVLTPAKKKILLQHSHRLENFIQVIRGKTQDNSNTTKTLKKLAFQMDLLRSRFTNTLQNLVSTISLSKLFRIKHDSLKGRLKEIIKRRDVYWSEILEPSIFDWKLATNGYNSALSEMDKKYRRNKMKQKWRELRSSLQFYDALVDVKVCASRLLVLYNEASKVNSLSMLPTETSELSLSIEDTECFLLLSEAKVMLLELGQTARNNDRIQIINVYLAADKMNIAKGMLQRTTDLERMECLRKNLISRTSHFSSQCQRVDLSAVVDVLPSPQNYLHAENKSIEEKILLRTNISNGSGNIELELAVKLLASSILRRTASIMLVLSPQMTTITDELLQREGDREKNRPRLALKNFLPMMRRHNTEYVKRCEFSEMQIPKTDTIHLKNGRIATTLKNNSTKILRYIQEKTANSENCIDNGEDDYNPGMHDISRSSTNMQLMCNAFVDQKLKEATYRRCRLLKKKNEELTAINGYKKLTNEAGNILEDIRKTRELVLTNSDPVQFGESKKLLKEQKAHFHNIQNQKRKRRFCSLGFELTKKDVVPRIDWNFEHIVDALESMCATNNAE